MWPFQQTPTIQDVTVPFTDHLELLDFILTLTLNFGFYIESKAQLPVKKLRILRKIRLIMHAFIHQFISMSSSSTNDKYFDYTSKSACDNIFEKILKIYVTYINQ